MSGIIKSTLLIITILYPLTIYPKNNEKIIQEIIKKDNQLVEDSIRAMRLSKEIGPELFLEGKYSQSLDTFLEALSIQKNILNQSEDNLASTYLGIAYNYQTLKDYNRSLDYYNLAANSYLLDVENNKSQIIRININIASIYLEKLDYSKALQYYERNISFYKQNYEIDKAEIAFYSYPIAELFYQTNEFDKSLKVISENIDNSYLDDRIRYYKLLAYINLLQGNIEESQRNFQNSIDYIISDPSTDSIDLADAYLQFASFLITNNQFVEADKILQKSFEIIDISEPSISLYRTEYYVNMGYYWNLLPVSSGNMEVFRKQKIQNLNLSNDYFYKALYALNFPENHTIDSDFKLDNLLSTIEAIKTLKLIADTYAEISDIYISENENDFPESLESAMATYQTVGSLIQRARRELTSDESKLQLTSLEYSTFYKMIQAASQAYKLSNDKKYIDLAFQSAERVKSSSVYDKISDQTALENSAVPDSLLTRENNLKTKITEYSEKIYSESTQPTPNETLIEQYNDTIFSLNQELDELDRFMESEYSDYYQLKYSNTMSSIEDIQNQMSQDQVIIEYVLNETDTVNELYTFLISKKNVSFYNQSFSSDFIQDVETTYGFVSDDNYLFTQNEDSKNFCESSFHLYQNLIEPYISEIKDKNITVIPDGKLSYIPFDALLTSLPDTSEIIQFNKLDYLIKSYNINYSNSSNLLFSKKSDNSLGNAKVLAFAPEYDTENFLMGNKVMTLIPLPGVKKEVEKISEIVKSKLFIDENATEENFRKNVENFDILHLAMHAFINDSLPAFSSLAFTQLDTTDDKADGLLNTADIYNLKLKAKLTVLSACNTGTGSLQKGEGILSLARGFLYAGCPSIIMSLWEVEDESGTQIMSSFYRNLKKGKNKDEALRAAKLEYLETAGSRKAHPHYWLSFVSIGDNAPLYVSYDYYFFILLILAFVGIAVDQILRIKKARKKQAL